MRRNGRSLPVCFWDPDRRHRKIGVCSRPDSRHLTAEVMPQCRGRPRPVRAAMSRWKARCSRVTRGRFHRTPRDQSAGCHSSALPETGRMNVRSLVAASRREFRDASGSRPVRISCPANAAKEPRSRFCTGLPGTAPGHQSRWGGITNRRPLGGNRRTASRDARGRQRSRPAATARGGQNLAFIHVGTSGVYSNAWVSNACSFVA